MADEVSALEAEIAAMMLRVQAMENETDGADAKMSPHKASAVEPVTLLGSSITPLKSPTGALSPVASAYMGAPSTPFGTTQADSHLAVLRGASVNGNPSSNDLLSLSPFQSNIQVPASPMACMNVTTLRKTQRNDAFAAHLHHLWGNEHSTGLIPGSSEEWEENYKKLEKLTANAETWMDFFTKKEEAGGDFAWGDFVVVKTLERDQDKRSMEAMYDLTPDRMMQLFNRHDNDGDGFLQFHEFSAIMKVQGFPKLDPQFRSIFRTLKVGYHGKGLTLPEFAVGFKGLKLAQYMRETQREGMKKGFVTVNFSVDEVESESVRDAESMSKYWFGHRKEGFKRWVHVDHPTEQLLLHLTIKYHLHPLGVRDALDLVRNPTNGVPIRCDRFGNHYYISLTYYYLVSTTSRVEFKTASVAIFMAGSPKWDTMISICHKAQQPRRPDADGVTRDVWKILMNTISSTHCRVREQKSDFLLYEMLAVCCQELRPIIQAERDRLQKFHAILLDKKCAFPAEYLQELSSIVMELSDLHRNLRPLRHLVQQLARDPAISSYAKMYFADLDEEVEQVLDDLQLIKENCKSISDDYHRFQEIRLNDALGVLTVASAVFMPAQFVSGVYGMNFEHMPELSWEYSYAIFWAFLVVYFGIGGMLAWKHFGHIISAKEAAAVGISSGPQDGKPSGGTRRPSAEEEDDGTKYLRRGTKRKSCIGYVSREASSSSVTESGSHSSTSSYLSSPRYRNSE